MIRNLLIFITILEVALSADAQQLTTAAGVVTKGVVKDLLPDGVMFMKMDTKAFDDTDDILKARSTKFSPKKFYYDEVKSINGVPLRAYALLYNYNPLYRLVERMKYQWTVSMNRGSFVSQAKALFLFLLILGVLVPLLTWLGARLTGSHMDFMGGVGISVLIYALGYAAVKGFEKFTIDGVHYLMTGGGQMGALIGLLVVAGLLIGIISKDNIISGLGMIVGWFVGIYAAIWLIQMI